MKILNETKNSPQVDYPYISVKFHDENCDLHIHEYVEFLYVCDGSIIVVLDNKQVLLKKGEMCLVNPYQVHTLVTVGLNKVCVIKCFVPDEYTNNVLTKNFIFPGDEYYSTFYELFEEIIKENSAKQTGYKLAVSIACNQFLLLMMRNLSNHAHTETSDQKKLKTKSYLMKNVNVYLENHFSESFSLNDIAEYCRYSKFHFSRLIKEILGIGFSEYLCTFRLRKSIHMLKESNTSIGNIAMACGFPSIRSYNRAFKTHFNCSPSQYKKRLME